MTNAKIVFMDDEVINKVETVKPAEYAATVPAGLATEDDELTLKDNFEFVLV